MTWAKPNVLRKIPTGPNPVIWDYRTLLAGKLRAAWDVRYGGEFAAGEWLSHRDVVSGIRVAPDFSRPTAVPDGTHFRGRRVIGITNIGRCMNTRDMPNVVPNGSKPEVFLVARLPNGASQFGFLCGCTDASADIQAGASMRTSSGNLSTNAAGNVSVAYADTTNVHLFNAFGEGSAHKQLIDNVEVGSAASFSVINRTTQAGVGALATGFTAGINAFVALWGICCPAMTSEERAQFYAIAREDWGF